MVEYVYFITGASSGFGELFVKQAIERGDKCIATARNVDQISHFKSIGAATLQLDVTASQEEMDRKVKEAIGIYGRIDVIVHSAGFGDLATLEEISHERVFETYNTMVFGPEKLTRSILPHFRSRKEGAVCFIGSMFGWEGVGGSSVYSGAKFAMEGMAESLGAEVKHLGIRILLVEPGFFRTTLLQSGKLRGPVGALEDYEPVNQRVRTMIEALNGKQPGDPVLAVARILDVVKGEGVAKGKAEGYPARLPLGYDALALIRKKCTSTLELLEEWEDVITSTDLPKGE